MMPLENDLYALAGLLEKYRASGVSLTAHEVDFICAYLASCAEGARAASIKLRALSDEMDAIVEAGHRPRATIFRVIEGGG